MLVKLRKFGMMWIVYLKDIMKMISSGVKENDDLYYLKDEITSDKGFKTLTKEEDIVEWARSIRITGVGKLHVMVFRGK